MMPCKIGISGALTQKHPDGSIRPVAYASRSLSPVEQRYSQTEREALSGVWVSEKFHCYIHVSQFDLLGDHKPLEVLLTGRWNPLLHSSTGVSPASLMMNRHIRTKIPCLDLPRPLKLDPLVSSHEVFKN